MQPNPIVPIDLPFGFELRWYGVLIGIGVLLATFIVYKRAPRHGISSEKVLDYIIVALPIGIIGARLYYVAFNWSMYNGDFFKIINIREGGLAIHGGLIFGIIAVAVMAWLKFENFFNLMDLAAPAIALAQSIGRWGNYFNSEAHGGPTDLPWAIIVDGQSVHPTFLYESLWCFVIFIVLLILDNNRKFDGQIICLYGMLYSVERFFVEALRTDSLMLGALKQAQVISAVIFVISLVGLILLRKRQRHTFNSRYIR